MKSKVSFIAAAVTAPLLFSLSLVAQTITKSSSASPAASASPAKQAIRPIPFHGMVSAVDQKNKTFTISGKEATRVFKVTDKTNIMKGAGTGTMKDIVDNEEVSGAYWKNLDGTLEAKFVKLGPTEKKTASPAPSPSTTPKSWFNRKIGASCISAAPAALDRYLAALPAMSLIPFAPFASYGVASI
jgi:hypothetical protein